MKVGMSLIFMYCAFLILIIEGCSLGHQYGWTAMYLFVEDQREPAVADKSEIVGYLLSDKRVTGLFNNGKTPSEIKNILENLNTYDYDSPVTPLRENTNPVIAGEYQITVYCVDHFTQPTRISIDTSIKKIGLTCRGSGYIIL